MPQASLPVQDARKLDSRLRSVNHSHKDTKPLIYKEKQPDLGGAVIPPQSEYNLGPWQPLISGR